MKKILFTFLGLLNLVFAQDHIISDGGTITACSGVLLDHGGRGDYPTQDDVETVIESGTGAQVRLTFNSIELYEFSPGLSIEEILIYDGVGTAGTLLQTLDNDTPLPIVIESTYGVTALTVYFDVQYTGAPAVGFEADIECFWPRQDFVSQANFNLTPGTNGAITLCEGQSVEMTAAGNYPNSGVNYTQDDASSTFAWEIYGGVFDTILGNNITYTFNEGGIYLVRSVITDVEGYKAYSAYQQINVSDKPNYDNSSWTQDPICLNQNNTLSLNSTSSNYNLVLAPPSASAPILLKSDVGAGTSSVFVTVYDQSEVITNINDIETFCIDIEHSWLLDFEEIRITCPNGQSILLFDENLSSAAGRVLLGEPTVNDDASPADYVYGNPFTYCFGPNNNGFILGENNQNVSYVDNLGDNISGEQAIPGVYNVMGNWSDLIGCPLNGEWQLYAFDDLAGDNGTIESFTITFNSSLNPSNYDYSFSPVVVDSSFNTPNLLGVNNNEFTFLADTVGDNNFVLTITDDIGCTYTEPFSFLANDAPEVNFTLTPQEGMSPLNVALNDLTIGADFTTVYVDGSLGFMNPYINEGESAEVHEVTLVAVSSAGCRDSLTKTFTVIPRFEISEIANIFSPNGDGVNDLFYIRAEGAKTATMTIYNRWGNTIAEFNPLTDGWNGATASGQELDGGVYFYVLSVESLNGDIEEREGSIYLSK